MIVQEILENNPALIRTWSDEGFYIIQNGTEILYEDAIDPIAAGRTYRESDIPIVPDEPEEPEELEKEELK